MEYGRCLCRPKYTADQYPVRISSEGYELSHAPSNQFVDTSPIRGQSARSGYMQKYAEASGRLCRDAH